MHPPLLPRLIVLLSAFIAAAALSADNSAAASPGREQFMAAMQRVRLHAPEPPDSSALKEYPIYEYLIAARLRRDLSDAPGLELDAAIDEFLRAHAGQPVARSVQHAWLASLARRRRWDWFLPRALDVTDPALLCDRLVGRLATGQTAGLAAEALARWSLPQRPPSECAEIFDWLRSQQLLTPALKESRARAALADLKTALAREYIAELPAERARPLLEWLQLLESPAATLNALAGSPDRPVEPEALSAGFKRLSYADPAAALELLPRLLARPDMTPALRGRLRKSAALGAAYARQPGAVAAFAQLSPDEIDPGIEEWRVRAALWAEDYAQALQWIDQMPAALAKEPRWRYWRARATAVTAGGEAAAPLYADIAALRDYYGYLAADHLQQSYRLNERPTLDDPAIQTALAGEPGIIRAHALFDCDMSDEAAAEWSAALANASQPMKVQAARMASRWGWYGQAIATLAQAGEWDDVVLRYPRPYPEVIAKASKLTQVPADWILAVMRQESLYRRDAVSRADARGLMQMQPATAIRVARRWQWPAPGRDALFDPDIAVTLGAAYVHDLLDRYDNQLDLTLAAYNAGPASVAHWLPPRPIDADIWIENIPYTETRSYVQHVLEHIVAFAAVREAVPPRLSSLLPPVRPPPAAAP